MERTFNPKDIAFYIQMYNGNNPTKKIGKEFPKDIAQFIVNRLNSRNYCIGKTDFANKLAENNHPYYPLSATYVHVGSCADLFFCKNHNTLFISCALEVFYHDCCKLYCTNPGHILIISQDKLAKNMVGNKSVFSATKKLHIICPDVRQADNSDGTLTIENAIIAYHNNQLKSRLRGGIDKHPFSFDNRDAFAEKVRSCEKIIADDFMTGVCAKHGLSVDLNCDECRKDIAGFINLPDCLCDNPAITESDLMNVQI